MVASYPKWNQTLYLVSSSGITAYKKRTYSQGRSPKTALATCPRRKRRMSSMRHGVARLWRKFSRKNHVSKTILRIGLWIFEIYGLGLQVQMNTSWRRDLLLWLGVFGIPETLQDCRNCVYHFQASTVTLWNGFKNSMKLDIKDNTRHQWFWTSDHK